MIKCEIVTPQFCQDGLIKEFKRQYGYFNLSDNTFYPYNYFFGHKVCFGSYENFLIYKV